MFPFTLWSKKQSCCKPEKYRRSEDCSCFCHATGKDAEKPVFGVALHDALSQHVAEIGHWNASTSAESVH